MDDWGLLRTYLAVARAGTLSAAAEQLQLSVSTVHRQLGQLEDALRTRLVERRGRGQVLTAAGEALLTRAARIEREVLGLSREVAESDHRPHGVVHLTTTDSIAHGWLMRQMPALRQALPRILLVMTVDNRQFRLGRGEADVALRPGARPDEPDVVARPVVDVAYAWYAADVYLARADCPRRRRDLRNHDIVAPEASLRHTVYGEAVAAWTDPARHVLRSASMLALADAVTHGAGVGVLPCFLADGRPGVKRVFAPEPEGPLGVLFHVEHRHVARVRAVVDWLTAALEADAAVFAGV